MVDIAIVNDCTVLTDAEIAAVVPAFQAQIDEDWAPAWADHQRGAITAATLHFVPKGDAVPAGYWPLYIMDTTDVPGAGGYHDDDTGTPMGKVFARDAMVYGEAWTVDASHEMLEMLGDSTTQTVLPVPGHPAFHCLQEVCDAVEADIFAYRKRGVLVTDFCLPHYFDPPAGRQPTAAYDFTGHLHMAAPGLLRGGYLGIEFPNGQWTQITAHLEDGSMSRRARTSHRMAHLLARSEASGTATAAEPEPTQQEPASQEPPTDAIPG